MSKVILTPINVERPPKHTKVNIRCLTCKKFGICNIRDDYLKTALSIENILGNPQQDYELSFGPQKIENMQDYFPTTIEFENEQEGELYDAFFKSAEHLILIYKVNGYLVCLIAHWDKDTYIIEDGQEIFYHLTFKPTNSAIELLLTAVTKWKEENFETPETAEYINTTYFSAILNCDFYEQDKTLTPEQGAKRMFCNCNCDDNCYHHLATFHKYAPIPLPKKLVCKRKNVEN